MTVRSPVDAPPFGGAGRRAGCRPSEHARPSGPRNEHAVRGASRWRVRPDKEFLGQSPFEREASPSVLEAPLVSRRGLSACRCNSRANSRDRARIRADSARVSRAAAMAVRSWVRSSNSGIWLPRVARVVGRRLRRSSHSAPSQSTGLDCPEPQFPPADRAAPRRLFLPGSSPPDQGERGSRWSSTSRPRRSSPHGGQPSAGLRLPPAVLPRSAGSGGGARFASPRARRHSAVPTGRAPSVGRYPVIGPVRLPPPAALVRLIVVETFAVRSPEALDHQATRAAAAR